MKKKSVSIIYAMTLDGIIGSKGRLPWPHLKRDMNRFKKLTLNKTVIMGRKTYESIGKELPKRQNLILSRNGLSLEDALARATSEEVFIIGGSEIYALTENIAQTLYETIVLLPFEGDTRFPFNIDKNKWSLTTTEDVLDEDTGITLKFNVWRRL